MVQTEIIMGMPISIHLADNPTEREPLLQEVFTEFRRIDQDFSTYKEQSLVSRFRRGEIPLSQTTSEFRYIHRLCQYLKIQTAGYFDAYYQKKFDPSGLVKGWAITTAANILLLHQQTNFYINAGGDASAYGDNQNQPWSAGIKLPGHIDQFARTFPLKNSAIATSGTYERGEHIANPHIAQPTNELLSITVIGPDICLADAWATALFAMGKEIKEHINKLPRGYQAYILADPKTAFATPGWPQS
jgi:thiamine biosynthesis lipoprotein